MSDLEEYQGKDALTADVAKDIAKRMRGKSRPTEAYRCRTCGHWHVGGVLTKTQRRVKFAKIIKQRRKTNVLS